MEKETEKTIEKTTEKNKLLYLLVLLLLFVSLLAFSISFYLDSKRVLEIKELPMGLAIGDTAGFNLDKGELNFGTLVEGSKGVREDVNIANLYEFPIEVDFHSKGDITPLLIFDKKMKLQPGERKKFSVSTVVITNEAHGNYTGKMTITFKKA